ncbi:phosphate regulon sensor histidine kinase PhoR [Kushneria aurantia]|uniref:Phosphate regulon sensor protein PhoR n=1 Tax=Kushneria aurantia TaxID=504092 RepID=A0ABV6G0S1_9GAMM|nr:phosphate regulon sensor histidine kinase PhoR [Kushneria aurantia]
MNYWLNELWRLAYLIVCFGILGFLLGYPGWGLALGLAIHLTMTLRHLKRLYRWLEAPVDQRPPDGEGVWGDLFDRLWRYQKGQQQLQNRLRSVLRRVQESAESMSEGVVMLDSRGCLDWWNSAAERLIGLDKRHDHGHHLTNYMRDPDFVRYFRRSDYSEPITLKSPVSDARSLACQITRFGDDERLLVIRDITRLQRLEQTRRDFVANVSHELRTPLTVLTGYLETWQDSAADMLPPAMQRGLDRMHEQTDRMQHLVEDLLTLSRLETSDRQRDEHSIDMAALCESLRSDGAALAAGSHGISCEIAEQRRLFGDQQEIHSALSNLVYNAVRYTPEGCHITIRYCRWGEAGAAVEVIDDGEGIAPEHIPRLTERFYRVDKSRSVASGGTGLGLAIVKHVLLRHDAWLEIDSDPGEGACFRCIFPAARMAAPVVVSAADSRAG